MTSVSKQYLSELKVPFDPDHTICHDSEDELDDGDVDPDHDIDKLELGGCYDDAGSPELEEWFTGLKHDPLMCACRVYSPFMLFGQLQEWLSHVHY